MMMDGDDGWWIDDNDGGWMVACSFLPGII